MRLVVALVLAMAGCSSRSSTATTIHNEVPKNERRVDIIRIIVRDYGKRLVEGATVRVYVDGETREARTDARGEARLAAPRGARVTATESDMYGTGIADGDTLEIVMAQMPI